MSLFTKEELDAKSPLELLKLAKANDFEYEGKPKRSELTADLLSIAGPEEEDDEELDDDEVEEEEELDDEELEEDEVEEDEPAPKKPAKKSERAKVKEAAGEKLMAAKQVAFELGIEAKTLRQFFRSPASTVEPVGSGGRYEFDEADLPKIKTEFEKWRAEHAARGSKRGPGKKGKSSTPVEEIEEIEEVEELEIEELDDDIDEEDLELEDDEEEED